MSTWEATRKNRWLKSVGSSDDPMALDWFESAPQELETIHFSKNPTGINIGDLLVYYATGHQKLLGIVALFMKPQFDAQLKRWQHHAPVRVKIMIKDIERAPSLDVLNLPGGRDFRKVVMKMDYVILEDAEYERALQAIEAAYDESKGDIRDEWFNRER